MTSSNIIKKVIKGDKIIILESVVVMDEYKGICLLSNTVALHVWKIDIIFIINGIMYNGTNDDIDTLTMDEVIYILINNKFIVSKQYTMISFKL